MKILDLVQGTDPWLQARLDHRTASEAAAMMGDSPYMSRNQLLALKKGWQANPVASFTQRLFDAGHEHEAMARPIVEMRHMVDFPPVVASEEIDGVLLLASYDGLSDRAQVWEHKDWNEALAENIRNALLEPLYYWQLEQQMMVCGTSQALITVSNGTAEKMVEMLYVSQHDRRQAVIDGWKQFDIDLESYDLEAKQEILVPTKITSLPVLQVKLEGSVVVSNAKEYLKDITELASIEMERKLENDSDFAEKDKMNKTVKSARDTIKDRVKSITGEYVSYSDFLHFMGQIDVVLQKMQAHGEKQVDAAKATKKREAIDAALYEYSEYIGTAGKTVLPQNLINFCAPLDTATAVKNKRSLAKIIEALDQEVADKKIAVTKVVEAMVENQLLLGELAEDYMFLFTHIDDIVLLPAIAFGALIKERIQIYKDQQAELEAERVAREDREAAEIAEEARKVAIEDQWEKDREHEKATKEEQAEFAGIDLAKPGSEPRRRSGGMATAPSRPIDKVYQEGMDRYKPLDPIEALNAEIQQWASKFGVSQQAVDELAVIVNNHNSMVTEEARDLYSDAL